MRQDFISIIATAIAFIILAYFLPFGGALFNASVLALLFLVVGVTFPITLKQQKAVDIEEGETEDEGHLGLILGYSMLAVAAFYVLSLVSPILPQKYIEALAVTSLGVFAASQLFSLMIAVAEEQFFRGFILGFFQVLAGPFAVGIQAVFFMLYHLAVYGDSTQSLFVVLGAGVVLGGVAYRTQKVSPTIIAHVLWNAIASGVVTGALTHPVGMVAPAIQIAVVIGFTRMLRGKRLGPLQPKSL